MEPGHLASELHLEQVQFDFQVKSFAHRVGDPGVALAVDRHPFPAVATGGRAQRFPLRHGIKCV
jgi:hypothetical protein